MQKFCGGNEIRAVERAECAKARSIKLEFSDATKLTTSSNYFISAETQKDLDKWLQSLNNIVGLMKSWQI